ncbi:MAG: AAA family ATPase [Anaerolineae bacterium]|nr:AAA family ATPase [Anaerolineae bacterium]
MFEAQQSPIGGRYRLLDELGRGGMGIVYRAHDRLSDRVVALKRVLFDGDDAGSTDGTHDDLRLILANEFRLLASLCHPNIITVLDYGFDQARQPFYTMDVVENHRIITQAALKRDLRGRLDLLRQVFEALDYLHRRGIVHYDLKPSNILVDTVNAVHVLDFGLAGQLARHNIFAGTPAYMSPEVLRSNAGTPASDLYTVGVILHEVFIGTTPFTSPNGKVDFQAVVSQPVDLDAITAVVGSLPLALVIARLLAKQPEDRYPDAHAAMAALYEAVGEPLPPVASIIRESHLRPPFIGRERPLHELTAALDAAQSGHGSVWLIGGESGVGKSRLADELRTLALTRGVQVLIGQGVENGGAPYQYWRMPLRQLVLDTPPRRIDAAPLAQIIPDLEALTGEPVQPMSLDPQVRQNELVNAIRALFNAQDKPTLLILEDLQWARESLIPLRALRELCPHLPLLIVGIFRSDTTPELPARVPGAQVILLDRFDHDEIALLCKIVLGGERRAAALIDSLYEQTQGNAFSLIEMLRMLAELVGGLDEIGDEPMLQTLLAEGTRSLIQRRLERVPSHQYLYLRYAALMGRDVDFAALHAIDPTYDFAPWLAAAINLGILESIGGVTRFVHDRVREVLVTSLPAARRAEVYWLVAAAYEAVHGDDSDYALRLYSLWKETTHSDKIRRCAERGAQVAYESDDMATTMHLLDHLSALTPADDTGAQAQIGLYYAQAAQKSGSPAHAEQALYRAINLAQQGEAPALLADLYNTVGVLRHNYGSHEEGIELSLKALEYARAVGDVEREAQYLSTLTVLYARCGHVDLAVTAQAEAEALLPQVASIRLRFKVSAYAAQVLRIQGKLAEAYAALQKTADEFSDSLGRSDLSRLVHNSAVAAWQIGRLDEAQQYAHHSLRLDLEIGDRWGVASTLNLLGYITFDQGDLPSAAGYWKRSLRAASESDAISLILDTLAGFAQLHLSAGETARAGELLSLALHHPAANEDVRITVEPILAALREKAEAPQVEEALARGAALDLGMVVRDMLL